jgi:hypothetical protein
MHTFSFLTQTLKKNRLAAWDLCFRTHWKPLPLLLSSGVLQPAGHFHFGFGDNLHVLVHSSGGLLLRVILPGTSKNGNVKGAIHDAIGVSLGLG